MTTEQTLQPSARVSWRSVAVLATLLAVPGLGYVATVLLPYYASDLDELTLTQLAGGGVEAAWPTPENDIHRWLHVVAFFSLLLAPLGALLALGGCLLQLLAAFPRDGQRLSAGVATALGVVALACLAGLPHFLSPLGRALTSWQLD